MNALAVVAIVAAPIAAVWLIGSRHWTQESQRRALQERINRLSKGF